MWHPASRSAGGEQECQLMTVHKTSCSGAKKQCGFNQGGPFGVRSRAVPEVSLCLLLPHKSQGFLTLWHFLLSEKLLKGA